MRELWYNLILNIYSRRDRKIKINSDGNLPLEKTTNMGIVVIFIMFAFNKNYNHYYCLKLLEKCSNK